MKFQASFSDGNRSFEAETWAAALHYAYNHAKMCAVHLIGLQNWDGLDAPLGSLPVVEDNEFEEKLLDALAGIRGDLTDINETLQKR